MKLAVLAAAGGCSGESALAPHGAAGGAEATGSGGASGSGGELDFGGAPGTGGAVGTGGRAGTGGAIPPAVPADVSATVDIAAHHQVLIGFGAAIAYYVNFLANRNLPGDDLPTVLFPELGLDILRVGNWYQTQSPTATSPQTAFSDFDTVAVVQKATAALGHAPRILMSSWSPPAYLKSNSATKAATPGTLAKVGGAYQYAAFGQWWAASLAAYASYGVKPDYISIQNEPDYFNSGWETCLFDATEGPSNAGFGPALDAVYDAVHNAPAIAPKPAILGPEVTGLASNKVPSYLAGLDPAHLDAVAHHLYNGADSTANPSPDAFLTAMTGADVAAAAMGKPLFMTEFAPSTGQMLRTAWLIHNALTVEEVSAYVYWSLIWGPSSAGANAADLVTVENPSGPFTTPKGYTINDPYYALKHFARWTDPGWTRVGASTTLGAVKASAFLSPDGRSLTMVLINTDAAAHVVNLGSAGFAFSSSMVYRSSGSSERAQPLSLDAGNSVSLPAGAIATVTR